MRILVAGATGFVAGHLVPSLLEGGHEVHALARRPGAIPAEWRDRVEVFEGDLLDAKSLAGMADGVDHAYYLVHGMADGEFEDRDAKAATNFRRVWAGPTTYLGGLQPHGEARAHLRSRAEVGRILADAGPTTEFRAGPIIGAGSASFEMARYLTERLPAMVTPSWVGNRVRPIAIADVVAYLVEALTQPGAGVYDIGTEPATFADLMARYAAVRGLPRRRLIRTPVLAPRLAARWVQFVTPVSNKVAIPIIDGIREDLIGDTRPAESDFSVKPMTYDDAVRDALDATRRFAVEHRWHTQDPVQKDDWMNILRETRSAHVAARPDVVFDRLQRMGGDSGWPHDWAWQLRGAADRAIGGPGLDRQRPAPPWRPGDLVDWWRVETIEPGIRIVLAARMKVPGRAWLAFDLYPEGDGSRLVQTALFEPKGATGVAYWYGLYPVHAVIFRDLVGHVGRP